MRLFWSSFVQHKCTGDIIPKKLRTFKGNILLTSFVLKVLEGLQLVIRYPMPFQTLSIGYRTPFFNKQGTFTSQFWKNEQNPQNYEYLLSTCQHRKITQALIVYFFLIFCGVPFRSLSYFSVLTGIQQVLIILWFLFIFPNFVGPKSTTKVLCMGIVVSFWANNKI